MTRRTTRSPTALGLLAVLALAAPAAADSHDAAAVPEPAERSAAGTAAGEAAPDAREPAPGALAPEVLRAQFTTAVEAREPVDRVEVLEAPARKVFFFTELRDFQGQRVVHRWMHDGEVRAEVPFDVKGERWRVYSSKRLLPGWTGEWTVAVVDGQGDVVAEERLVYREGEGSAGGAERP